MTQLVWGAEGERFFEAGVDRGVLYVDNAGVAWNGLVSVNESPVGGEALPYYVDGVKYLNQAAREEFEATIEAYTYPDEFSECDGTAELKEGLFATQQVRKPFGLSYRTKIGNDLEGIDHGYKIHLVYNALTSPSKKDNTTFSEEISPFNFSWGITAKPLVLDGYRPTAHFIIDSRSTPEELLSDIEDILYGTAIENPRLPTIYELIALVMTLDIALVDAGAPTDVPSDVYDGGAATVIHTAILDGGPV